jgi:hypothetical protein
MDMVFEVMSAVPYPFNAVMANRLALNGGELPNWLLYQAVKRNRAEQRVTRPRAALIKMSLLSLRKVNMACPFEVG